MTDIQKKDLHWKEDLVYYLLNKTLQNIEESTSEMM